LYTIQYTPKATLQGIGYKKVIKTVIITTTTTVSSMPCCAGVCVCVGVSACGVVVVVGCISGKVSRPA